MKLAASSILVVLAIHGGAAPAETGEPAAKNYVLFPIKTDLQRRLLPGADAFLLLDVAGCVRDKKFDLQQIDKEEFQRALAALVRQTGLAKPRLHLRFLYVDVSLDAEETKRMESAILTLCRQSGFAKIVTSGAFGGASRHDRVALIARLVDDDNPAESTIEDDLVRAYPVRTKLSRLLFGNAATDCFIELRQPIDGRFADFSPATRQAIGRVLVQLGLRSRRDLRIDCQATTAGAPLLQRYFEPSAGKPSRGDAFVKELGFQSVGYSMTPMGVRPEELLGKRAPDFTLDAAGGGQLHLHELIRGRVAVIAFWGIPCGPCRAEAPCLTALYNRFRDKGLAVIAVDGYDDKKEDVERFVRTKGLTHSIALMGGKVAQAYTVDSYPVTYLVDHTGAIVDYRLGFDPDDEKPLALAIDRLLAARESAKK
jgi:peroxiredoxin